MNFSPENVYHIYNQGNNHQKIFSCDEEYEIFLNLVRTNISVHCEIINWCLMPNPRLTGRAGFSFFGIY
ncbi:MAG: hypothetical protein ABI366_06475 [Ginsengibacter sp.]